MDEKLKKRVDVIADELIKFPEEAIEGIREYVTRHSYSARLDANHNARDVMGIGNTCSKTDLIVLSGRDVTDRTGKATIPISQLLCGQKSGDDALVPDFALTIIREPNFVATPDGPNPSLATVQNHYSTHRAQGVGIIQDRDGNRHDKYLTDVAVEVEIWKIDGSAASGTKFSWICTIETALLISIGG